MSRITRRSSAEIAAHGACHVSVLGDSAGANIALASVEYLVANNQTVPAATVLPSPPVDGWWTNPNVAWAGNLPVNDYEVSPLNGPLTGLPPTTIYAGSRDIVSPKVPRSDSCWPPAKPTTGP
ncbi:hypothetical protein AWC11_10780 [Mycobacterium interjectum]|nr:hypothetical protein AWC11_10780 [Mycobacterium interjectum]